VVQISPATLAISNAHFIGEANFVKPILCGIFIGFLEVAPLSFPPSSFSTTRNFRFRFVEWLLPNVNVEIDSLKKIVNLLPHQ